MNEDISWFDVGTHADEGAHQIPLPHSKENYLKHPKCSVSAELPED
jgi:hypothetical protein